MGKNRMLLGTRKGLVSYSRTANGWSYDGVEFEGIPVTLAHRDARTGSLWAMLDHGHWGCKVHRSDDEGNSWRELTAPQYPEGAMIDDSNEATLKLLWAFGMSESDSSGRIWIGTEPGGLFYTDDQGDSFHLVESLWNHPSRGDWFGGGRDNAAIHSILVNPNDSAHVRLAISCAGVFESRDHGASWTVLNKGMKAEFLPDVNAEIGQDPHLMVASKQNFDKLWQQNHCGIFRSGNGGELWEDVSDPNGEANFGFAISVHDRKDDVAWVVPAQSDETRVAVDRSLCVCRTEDGGKSWRSFRSGLPQDAAFDICFRHAMDSQGDEVFFGTTTGNLYSSADGGEKWDCLSTNLPMIHSIELV